MAPVVLVLVLQITGIFCDDNFFALLSGTLKTFQKAACDDQQVSLRCPPGTCISVLVAQYGNSAKDLQDLCPDALGAHVRNNLTCPFPTELQYSLLQTVMEACHKKRQCKFLATPRLDPCPGFRKYIEVAYKCRPYEFRSKVACQDDTLQLSCNPHSRVAVYSASFGRTEYESVRCPQPQGVREETCLATYATETVMQICHGKRQCSIKADALTFGSPCHHQSKTYLKIVYTCVPKTVLREQFEDTVVEEDEGVEPDYDVDYDSVDNALRENHVYSESPRLAVAGGHTNGSAPVATQESTAKEEDFKETRDRIVLSLVFAIVSGMVLMAALVAARCLWMRRRPGDKQLTKVYSEEADQEIDLTATSAVTVLPSPQEVIRYKEETPLSMGTNSATDYYYG
ncbi:protein eva-1 homolog C-like isoform X2 [Macrosteles quadrilineatus]|uniref:protein eva-1 homolog C-like isoform X2 n=1 Tax=Macrosteles quadrilineatus TaxID=74068 RepID=UPI0023E0B33E|nr:protein eva-1 homolog C-like isoform X2 [Macrosteles quadrilineatus]